MISINRFFRFKYSIYFGNS